MFACRQVLRQPVRAVVRAETRNISTVASVESHKWAFFGAPGVGKGTFASRVAPAANIPTISTGDLIREQIKAGTELGKSVEELNAKGQLVPDEVVAAMVDERLAQSDCADGFILDGFPRTIPQAQHLAKTHPLDRVINFTLKESALMKKLTGRRVCDTCGRAYNIAAIHDGELDMPPLLPKPEDCDTCEGEPPLSQRADDTEEVISARLKVYDEQTHPLVDFFDSQGLLTTFEVKKGIADMPRLFEELDLE